MPRKRRLEWGETPWDKLSREELLIEVKRMCSAVASAEHALVMTRGTATDSFWGAEGSGGIAIEKCRQITDSIHVKFNESDIYRSFYRYADDLLFSGVGRGWLVCETGHMVGGGKLDVCRMCNTAFRPIEWRDLAPVAKGGSNV